MSKFISGHISTRRGSRGVSNALLQQKNNAIAEFNEGVIGLQVWKYLFMCAGVSYPVGWESFFPSSESLRKVGRSKGEMVILSLQKIGSFKLNGLFWGNLGVTFKTDFSSNGFSLNQYLQMGMGIEEGVYIGNPSGVMLGEKAEVQKKAILDQGDAFIPFVGLQIIPEAVHRVLFDRFLNPNHVVRCNCPIKNNVLVGGGDSSIRIVDSGIHYSKVSLGCMKRVFIE